MGVLRFTILVLVGFFVLGERSVALAASLVDTIKLVKPSVVGVGTYQEIRRPPSNLLGTGFHVADEHHILTNSHVLPKSIVVDAGMSINYFDASVVGAVTAADVD